LSTQQIIIYVISALVVLSMAIGYLVGNSRRASSVPTPTMTTVASTPAPDASSTDEVLPTSTPAPTQAK
jgi:hypothetical protein